MNILRRSNSLLSSLRHSLKHNPKPFDPTNPHPFTRSFHSFQSAAPLHRFRRRSPKWYQNPRNLLIVTVVTSAGAVSLYYGHLEPVPYTKRNHLILLSPPLERQLGESQFQQLKAALQGKILPPLHPDSIRVRLICKQIIEALHHSVLFTDTKNWTDMSYGSEAPSGGEFMRADRVRDTIKALGEEKESGWNKDEVVLEDDGWVAESRRKGEERGVRAPTRHLEGLNWEVIVVRDPTVNAMCLPGGKIVVFTGLLDRFRTDAEIATVIGHEVAHAVARHSAEMITKNLWFAILQIIVLQFIGMPDFVGLMSNLLLRLPFSRRMEMEADYIGLLLAAAAGYDPRIAPKVYEKLGEITGDSSFKEYLSTHPSSKKRAQLLSQAKVMQEALDIYREAISGRRMTIDFL